MLEKNDTYPSKIQYSYEYAPETRLYPAHGIWGGINLQGEIELNFYSESEKIPAHTEQFVNPDGSLEQELPVYQDKQEIVRTVHSRLLLNYQTARLLLEWLEEKVGELETDKNGSVYDPNTGIKQ